jgi:hypothetical protein
VSDVSEEHTASIFSVKSKTNKKPAAQGASGKMLCAYSSWLLLLLKPAARGGGIGVSKYDVFVFRSFTVSTRNKKRSNMCVHYS